MIIMSDYIEDIHKELSDVSEAGNIGRVRELLEAGADPDKYKDEEYGMTALQYVAVEGQNVVSGKDINPSKM